MPHAIDFALVAVLVAWVLWDQRVAWPRFARAAAAGEPGARPRFYRSIALGEWALTAITLGVWWYAHRAPAALGLSLPTGGRLAGSIVVVAGAAALAVVQVLQVAALPDERRARVRQRLAGPIAALLPHTSGERTGFVLLSLTAGVCEELLARGYLVWFFGSWIGPWPGLLVASALFGLGHAYQGRTGIAKTAVVGLLLGAIYLLTGSLVAGMLAHAAIDVGAGLLGHALLRQRPAA